MNSISSPLFGNITIIKRLTMFLPDKLNKQVVFNYCYITYDFALGLFLLVNNHNNCTITGTWNLSDRLSDRLSSGPLTECVILRKYGKSPFNICDDSKLQGVKNPLEVLANSCKTFKNVHREYRVDKRYTCIGNIGDCDIIYQFDSLDFFEGLINGNYIRTGNYMLPNIKLFDNYMICFVNLIIPSDSKRTTDTLKSSLNDILLEDLIDIVNSYCELTNKICVNIRPATYSEYSDNMLYSYSD